MQTSPLRPGTRILVVEDDQSISRLLELELGHRGFDVQSVTDGLAALEAIESLRPQAIVLDILLPGMDGEHILQRLRRRSDTTPVIMLTAKDRVTDKIRNLDTGADDYLTKPFDPRAPTDPVAPPLWRPIDAHNEHRFPEETCENKRLRWPSDVSARCAEAATGAALRLSVGVDH